MAVPLLYALRCNLGLHAPRFGWLRLMAAALLASTIGLAYGQTARVEILPFMSTTLTCVERGPTLAFNEAAYTQAHAFIQQFMKALFLLK